jgi:hypothetical protein
MKAAKKTYGYNEKEVGIGHKIVISFFDQESKKCRKKILLVTDVERTETETTFKSPGTLSLTVKKDAYLKILM